ncbi:MAG: hypothetical protein KDC46_15495, partial [Thermoleophilia bacterium]|nr:hypothetical protein [Thermoleophilia bacterium]
KAKLAKKGADLIVANDVSRPDAGFEHPTNAVTILRSGGLAPIDVPLADKRTIAERVLDAALAQRASSPAPETDRPRPHLRTVN